MVKWEIKAIQPPGMPYPVGTETIISMSSSENITQSLGTLFAQTMAEAQLLEDELKQAMVSDIQVFASSEKQTSMLEILEKATLGQTTQIASGNGTSGKNAAISQAIGFYKLVKLNWHLEGDPESELPVLVRQGVERRNHIAHEILADLLSERIADSEAFNYLTESVAIFRELRIMFARAHVQSSQMGSVATDGSTLPRFTSTR